MNSSSRRRRRRDDHSGPPLGLLDVWLPNELMRYLFETFCPDRSLTRRTLRFLATRFPEPKRTLAFSTSSTSSYATNALDSMQCTALASITIVFDGCDRGTMETDVSERATCISNLGRFQNLRHLRLDHVSRPCPLELFIDHLVVPPRSFSLTLYSGVSFDKIAASLRSMRTRCNGVGLGRIISLVLNSSSGDASVQDAALQFIEWVLIDNRPTQAMLERQLAHVMSAINYTASTLYYDVPGVTSYRQLHPPLRVFRSWYPLDNSALSALGHHSVFLQEVSCRPITEAHDPVVVHEAATAFVRLFEANQWPVLHSLDIGKTSAPFSLTTELVAAMSKSVVNLRGFTSTTQFMELSALESLLLNWRHLHQLKLIVKRWEFSDFVEMIQRVLSSSPITDIKGPLRRMHKVHVEIWNSYHDLYDDMQEGLQEVGTAGGACFKVHVGPVC
ncbi:hypothetical protein GQ42DRAFT_82464 [Ramicandelaber brevisporus]|nr:hypothetical protein GQ42DRAFT_82464 [Ramicandelaber brevisporus]